MDTPADASGIPASRVGQVSFLELAQGQGVTGGRRCCIFFLKGLKDQQDFNVEGHPVAAGPCAPTTEPDLSQDGSGKHYNNTFTPNTVHLFDFVPVFLRSFGINSPS